MKIVNSISEEARKTIITHLQDIVRTARSTESLFRKQAPCDQVFRLFTGIRDLTDEVESKLLTYQLENCLLPQLGQIQEIVTILNGLVRRKQGALMVIQRNDDLSKFIKTGTAVDAIISAPLIESIFFTGNPLHDGAVIINNNRVAAAGCILPLTQRTLFEYGKPMGMRHRAALGLTEQTDALVIVVSEETQRVSLALGGHLYRLKKSENLWKKILDAARGELK